MEVNTQLVIDELIKKVNTLTVENIVLQAQVRQMSEIISANNQAQVSPNAVMSGTIESQGKYDEAIASGRIGAPAS